MREFWTGLADRLEKGEAAVLVSILDSSGSTPRGPGARMAVFRDGGIGTIGGGAVEYRCAREAKQLLAAERSVLRHYDLSAGDAAGLGMICGGRVTVHLHYLPAGAVAARFFKRAATLCAGGEPAWLASRTGEDGYGVLALIDETGVAASWPEAGFAPDRTLPGRDCVSVRQGTDRLLIQPLRPPGEVYLFGGGHVAQSLAPLLEQVHFRCTVVDDAPEFASRERFPTVHGLRVLPFNEAVARLPIGGEDYIVIMTRGHLGDYAVLSQALGTPARYIGMIGSRAKIAETFRKLREEQGFSPGEIARVRAPIGLPIGGDTPEEIAVSVAAQLIQERWGTG